MAVRFPAGVLGNLGGGPKCNYPPNLPNPRMGTANLIRTTLAQAQSYGKKKPATPNMKLEALQPFLGKKLPVIFSAHRADDLLTGLRLAEEFDLRPMLTLATEGYLVADKLAGIPVIVH